MSGIYLRPADQFKFVQSILYRPIHDLNFECMLMCAIRNCLYRTCVNQCALDIRSDYILKNGDDILSLSFPCFLVLFVVSILNTVHPCKEDKSKPDSSTLPPPNKVKNLKLIQNLNEIILMFHQVRLISSLKLFKLLYKM